MEEVNSWLALPEGDKDYLYGLSLWRKYCTSTVPARIEQRISQNQVKALIRNTLTAAVAAAKRTIKSNSDAVVMQPITRPGGDVVEGLYAEKAEIWKVESAKRNLLHTVTGADKLEERKELVDLVMGLNRRRQEIERILKQFECTGKLPEVLQKEQPAHKHNLMQERQNLRTYISKAKKKANSEDPEVAAKAQKDLDEYKARLEEVEKQMRYA
jgi:hypothetical protein